MSKHILRKPTAVAAALTLALASVACVDETDPDGDLDTGDDLGTTTIVDDLLTTTTIADLTTTTVAG